VRLKLESKKLLGNGVFGIGSRQPESLLKPSPVSSAFRQQLKQGPQVVEFTPEKKMSGFRTGSISARLQRANSILNLQRRTALSRHRFIS
jgi:hypothetical protein